MAIAGWVSVEGRLVSPGPQISCVCSATKMNQSVFQLNALLDKGQQPPRLSNEV